MAPLLDTECLEYGDECAGTVEYRLPLSPTGRAFPRCAFHWLRRLDFEEEHREKYGSHESDVPPRWFDPTAAGERWEDD